MSDPRQLEVGVQKAADSLVETTIAAFWKRFDQGIAEKIANAQIKVNPEIKLKSLILNILVQSVEDGWIDVNTYAYVAFMHSSPIDIDRVFEFLAERVAEFGRLTTTDLAIANEIARQVRSERRQPKRRWFSWLS